MVLHGYSYTRQCLAGRRTCGLGREVFCQLLAHMLRRFSVAIGTMIFNVQS